MRIPCILSTRIEEVLFDPASSWTLLQITWPNCRKKKRIVVATATIFLKQPRSFRELELVLIQIQMTQAPFLPNPQASIPDHTYLIASAVCATLPLLIQLSTLQLLKTCHFHLPCFHIRAHNYILFIQVTMV